MVSLYNRLTAEVNSKAASWSNKSSQKPALETSLAGFLVFVYWPVGYFPYTHFSLQCVQNLYEEKQNKKKMLVQTTHSYAP